jgi:hypothetical protein
LDHAVSSSSEDDIDVQDGDQLDHAATVAEEKPRGGPPEDVVGCTQERPAVDMLNQQPSVTTKGGVVGGRGGGRYDPNRYRLHFESESKEEIERRKRAAKTVHIVPLPEVSFTFSSNTQTHICIHTPVQIV